MKIGRNEPCWCGSGKKYKKCHLNREQQERLTIQDAISANKKANNKECLHPKASPDVCNHIIKAHSIQRAVILQRISRKQHVYGFSAALGDLMKKHRLEPKLIGINDASTFTGFCNYHDTELFSPIENNSIEIATEHIFLIAYRALCKEISAKKYQMNMIPSTKEGDKGFDIEEQLSFQLLMKDYQDGVTAGLKDLMMYKDVYDSYLLSENFSDIVYYAIEIEGVPDFVVSGQIHVEMDFNGNILHTPDEIMDLSKRLDAISFSVLMKGSNGLIIFSCFNFEDKSIEFLKSIDTLNNTLLPDAIVRFAFEYFENNYFSPDWWESLSDYNKEGLIKRVNDSTDFEERSNEILKDDGHHYVNWKVVNRFKNF